MGQSASADTKQYLEGYPGKRDDPNAKLNIQFYSNEVKSKPNGGFIDEIHKDWFGQYDLLEAHHGYIQWLFPIREDGLNNYAQQLQLHEAKAISEDPKMLARIIKSYELMLDFYGMKLVDSTTGKIERNPTNWKSRYSHLNRSFHNYLRITRILKCLGEVGLERLKAPFLEHILTEIFVNGELKNCKESCLRYWCQVLRDPQDRQRILQLVQKYVGGPQDSDSDNDQNNDHTEPTSKPAADNSSSSSNQSQETNSNDTDQK